MSASGVIIMESEPEAVPVSGVAVLLRSSRIAMSKVLWTLILKSNLYLDLGLLTSMASHFGVLLKELGHCLNLVQHSATSLEFS